jgi:hypothetical protein
MWLRLPGVSGSTMRLRSRYPSLLLLLLLLLLLCAQLRGGSSEASPGK